MNHYLVIILAIVIGSAVLAAVIRLLPVFGPAAWLICWGTVSLFQLFILFIAPVTIIPSSTVSAPWKKGN